MLGVAAVATAIALVFSGCGSVKSGTAVQVDDSTLTVSQFQSQVEDLVDKSGRENVEGKALRQVQHSLLRQYVDNQLIRVVAREKGISVSGAEISTVLSQIEAQHVIIPDAMLHDFARWVALDRKLVKKVLGSMPKSRAEQSKADRTVGDLLIRAGRKVGVQVNPRYGSWNAGQVVAGGALVTPKASASTSPAMPPG